MRNTLRCFLAAILFAVVAAPLSAQDAGDALRAEEHAVRSVIDRMFDGMRQRDTTMMRSVFADEAQFYGVGRGGSLQVSTPSDFITSISGAPAEMVLDEVLHDVLIRVDGPLAIAWTGYDFFAGDNFSHCGYNSFQLLKLSGEWKIVALADSRRGEGCRQERAPAGK